MAKKQTVKVYTSDDLPAFLQELVDMYGADPEIEDEEIDPEVEEERYEGVEVLWLSYDLRSAHTADHRARLENNQGYIRQMMEPAQSRREQGPTPVLVDQLMHADWLIKDIKEGYARVHEPEWLIPVTGF